MIKILSLWHQITSRFKVASYILKNNGKEIIKSTPKTGWAIFTAIVTSKQVFDSFGLTATINMPVVTLLLLALLSFLISFTIAISKFTNETYKLVNPDESPYENLEVRVVASYLDNAFEFYPDSVMCFGVNSAFIFKYAGPASLVNHFFLNYCSGEDPEVIKEMVYREKYPEASEEELTKLVNDDLASRIANGHITREEIQRRIDAELEDPKYEALRQEAKLTTYADDTHRLDPIRLRDVSEKGKEVEDKSRDEEHKQYPIGTVVMIDLSVEGSGGRKLTLIANSLVNTKESLEVDTSADPSEKNVAYTDFKVHYDPSHPVGDSYDEIWKYFHEHNNVLSRRKLLVPLIGAGVAAEKYNDFLLFVKMVDLYFDNLYEDRLLDRPVAVPQLVINIQDKSAASSSKAKKKAKAKAERKAQKKLHLTKAQKKELRLKAKAARAEKKKADKAKAKKGETVQRRFPIIEAFEFIDQRFNCYEAMSKSVAAKHDIDIEAIARKKRLEAYNGKTDK